MKIEERRYLNTFSLWGVSQYDPGNTDNIKSLDPVFRNRPYRGKTLSPKPNSRYLSPHTDTYLS